MWRRSAIFFATLMMLAATAPLAAQSPTLGVGRPPSPEEIRELGSAIAPDGTGLPEGSGTVAAGREMFAAQCARCHGPKAQGDVGPILVGGQGSLATARPLKTVGSFWPYATTLWDYINRIIGDNDIMDAKTLPKVKIPNRDGFVADPRPDVGPKSNKPK